MTYPTMQKIGSGLYQSEEQRDGVPDYQITKEPDGRWWIKGRTSGSLTWEYTARDALETIAGMYPNG